MVSVIRAPRLDLVSLGPEVLRLTELSELAGIEAALGVRVPPGWPGTVPSRLRLAQLTADAGQQPWLARAVVLRAAGRVVGYINFHAPPDERGRVEIGYEMMPGDRRRGYAREAVRALTGWAFATGAARVCVAAVAPGNAASLSLVRSLRFVQVGEQVDAVNGRELIFERPLPLDC